jgi:Xaa-Pro aminopeptidase
MCSFERRVNSLREKMKASKLEAILLVGWENIYYFTGMSSYQSSVGSANLMPVVVTSDDLIAVVTNGFAKCMAEDYPHVRSVLGFSEDRLISPFVSRGELVRRALPSNLRRVGIDLKFCSVTNLNELRKQLDSVEFTDTTHLIYELRMVKDAEEIARLREAAKITDLIYDEMIRSKIRQGVSESQTGLNIVKLAAEYKCSVPFVQVFSGPRAFYQNVTPCDRRFAAGDVVLLDYGVTYLGYNTDITRAVCLGRATEEQRELCEKVKFIVRSTISAIRPGVSVAEVDRAARRAFEEAGVKDHYIHRSGHGLGIAKGAEPPELSEAGDQEIKANMVLAIEQGVYRPHLGIRLEDNVLVTENGVEDLTSCSLDLAEVV